MPTKLFISYARKDGRDLALWLTGWGAQPQIDRLKLEWCGEIASFLTHLVHLPGTHHTLVGVPVFPPQSTLSPSRYRRIFVHPLLAVFCV